MFKRNLTKFVYKLIIFFAKKKSELFIDSWCCWFCRFLWQPGFLYFLYFLTFLTFLTRINWPCKNVNVTGFNVHGLFSRMNRSLLTSIYKDVISVCKGRHGPFCLLHTDPHWPKVVFYDSLICNFLSIFSIIFFFFFVGAGFGF